MQLKKLWLGCTFWFRVLSYYQMHFMLLHFWKLTLLVINENIMFDRAKKIVNGNKCWKIKRLWKVKVIVWYSRVWNKHTPTFINFLNFFQGLQSYYGLKRLKFYYTRLHILRGYVYHLFQIFQRLRLFKVLRLFWTLEYVQARLWFSKLGVDTNTGWA